MQKLSSNILKLLQKHNCVIVPNFGGFVVNGRSAVADRTTNKFYPPVKEIVFNQHLTHNDGLLAQEYMKEKSISFDEANAAISEVVKSVKQELVTRKIFIMPGLGKFENKNGAILFLPFSTLAENKDAFGLYEFYYPTIKKTEKKVVLESSVETSKTNNGRLISGSVAAAVLLMLFCQPIHENSKSNMASMYQLPAIKETAMTEEKQDLSTKDVFRIVVSAHQNEADAINKAVEMGASAVALQVINYGDSYLITTEHTDELSEATAKLDSLRATDEHFSSAFILGLKENTEK